MNERIPSTLSTVLALAGITITRLGRGKALWIGVLIAALPVAYAIGVHARHVSPHPDDAFTFSLLVLGLLPAMFVGASIGEEIEDRTSTYLWSRPIARWAVLAGKLCALAPIVIGLLVGGWVAAIWVWTQAAPSLTSCLALAAGCVAGSLIAAGIASVVPKHGMALTIGYMLVDAFIGALPFSLSELSISHQTRVLANLFDAQPALATPLIAMTAVAGGWSVIGFLRIRRLES
ncbi:MAG TPA: ABC transporter permease [Kofleriaceae bacterium]|jgi:ABC-type transport system involved in multi-copper enzyme maturation permease subunit|nr:ABC transporter permease [Kofleriaceae bacterium]